MLTALRKVITGDSASSPREALRAAIGAKAEAERVLAAAKKRTQRVQSIIDAADDFEMAAKHAQRAAQEASRSWAAGGATDVGLQQRQEAMQSAREAELQAQQARTDAEGATEAIGGLREAEQEAQYAVERADRDVKAAAREVIYAHAQPLLERLQRVANEVPTILADVAKLQSLRNMLGYSETYDRCGPLFEALRRLERIDSDLRPEHGGIDTWSLILRLGNDPDAVLDEL